MLFRMIAVMALLIASTVAHAQGRTAVVDLEQAILQTDLAQQRIRDFEASEAFAEDRAEFDNLKTEFDKLVQNFQKTLNKHVNNISIKTILKNGCHIGLVM